MPPEQFSVEPIHRPDRRVTCVFRIGDPALIMTLDVFHRPDASLHAAFKSSKRSPLVSQSLRMKPQDDLAGALQDESLPHEVEAVLYFEYSGLICHRKTISFQMALHDQLRFLYCVYVVVQNKKVVIIPDIGSHYALHLMIKLVEKRYLMQLIYLRAKTGAASSERIHPDLFFGTLIP